MKKLLFVIILLFGGMQLFACIADKLNGPKPVSTIDTMQLKITIGEKTATAVLYDNPTSKDFASLLPLTLKLEDYANTEKIATLSKKLSTKDAPKGFDPSVGDLTYYAPWGNLALFYHDFSYSNGLISLGKITSGMNAFSVQGDVTIKIEFNQ